MTDNQGKRLAKSADYAKRGAEAGFQCARARASLKPQPGIDLRLLESRWLKELRAIVADLKRVLLKDGASQFEVNLYEQCWELALQAGLNAAKIGIAPRPIRVKTDSGEIVIEDQAWVPKQS